MGQEFAYVKKENGICILRCYGTSGHVEIPQELEGVPVTEVSAYAFAEEQEGEPENTSGLPCICGEKLEELSLPRTIQRLGRYLFYNCLGFCKLSCYSNLAFMGAGAFTGCENLSHLVIQWLPGKNCLREILQDLRQKVTVDCYEVREGSQADFRKICQLVYPDFFEEAVENTPARIISTQTHGMGIQYRNAFRDTQVVFKEYDRLFETGKYNIDLNVLIEMAAARLRYPYELEEAFRREYAGWLSGHFAEASGYFLEREDMGNLRWLAQEFVSGEGQMETLLAAAGQKDAPEAVSMLMDVKRRKFPGRKRKFSL